MIQKRALKSRPTVKVTFEIPAEIDADDLQLVADFTDWSPVSFNRLKNGKWKLQHEVEPGRDYQFRYRLVRGQEISYVNDTEADGFIANGFGTQNALIAC